MHHLSLRLVQLSSLTILLSSGACSSGNLTGSTHSKSDQALTQDYGGSANATGTGSGTGGSANGSGSSTGTVSEGGGTAGQGEGKASNGSGSGGTIGDSGATSEKCKVATASAQNAKTDADKAKAAAQVAVDCAITGDKISKGLKKCLDAWGGKSPFTTASPYRKIGFAVSVLGFGSSIDDTNASADPELVVIGAAVNVLSITKYRLLNPKGWYCLIADVNVASKLTVDLHTDAHLADSRVDVDILSAGSNAGIVAVSVLSDVTVKRVDK
ncbi:MAG: hypothetical protein NTZ90_12800 [Proteobacteria bacterium]|nr:hypothetical protein [Pseudomonadota bacterium]